MLEQFQNLLDEPSYSTEEILQQTRNLVLNALETMFPSEFNFDGLASMCNDPRIANNDTLLTYHLVDYFVQLIAQHFVSSQTYEALEAQTQKLESTIRSHIRLQQEVKMYLEHLEYKIAKYQAYFQRQQKGQMGGYVESIPSQQQTQLRRQRISLIRTNEQLKRQLDEKNHQLKEKEHELEEKTKQLERLKSEPTESEYLKARGRLVNIKSQARFVKAKGVESERGAQVKSVMEREQGLTISITGNNNEFNLYKAT